jgi:hypothetical protein
VSTCDDCGPCGIQSSLESIFLPAGPYYIVVDGFGRTPKTGTYQITASCSVGPSTSAVTAIETLSCGRTVTGNTSLGIDNFQVSSTTSALDHTYDFYVTQPDSYTISTCQSVIDTRVSLFRVVSEISGQTLSLVDSCDDCGPCIPSTVLTNLELIAGRYQIVVTGAKNTSGTYTLTVSCGLQTPTAVPTESPTPSPPLSCCTGDEQLFLSSYGACDTCTFGLPSFHVAVLHVPLLAYWLFARSLADQPGGSNHLFCGEDINQNNGNLPGCTNGFVGEEAGCTDPNVGLIACEVCQGCRDVFCPRSSVVACDPTCA